MSDFNLDWKFKKNDSDQWQMVNLPHDAMIFETRDMNCHNGKNTGYFPGGKYVYEKTFSISNEDWEKEVSVLFEGIYQNCVVLLNGEEICFQKYGYTEFTADLTGKVKAGENKLTVNVDNSLEPNSRWYTGSGIYRPVHLFIREMDAPKKLKIRTISICPAEIEVLTEIGNTIVIADNNQIVCEKIAEEELTIIRVPDAKIWSEKQPDLYKVTVHNKKGELSNSFGIRTLSWDAKKGLLVNNERVLLRGGCIHHDNGLLGACEFEDAAERRVRIMKEAGYNAIRSSHNPMSRALLDACDRLGVFVMDEAFDGWYTPKTHHDNSRTFHQFWKDDIKALVDKDYNHPSVIMYSIGNEMTETSAEEGQKFCGIMRDYVHELDSSRPVTAGINIVLNMYTNKGMGVYEEKEPYEAKPLPRKEDGYEEKKTGSAFFNMMAGKYGWLMFYLSGGKKADKAAAPVAENLDVIGFNYAASRFKTDLIKYPERLMVASETLASDLPYNWPYVKKHPAVLGDFVWTAWDYLGEAGLGDWVYPTYKGLPLLAGCGAIDLTGKVTAQNFYEQVIWGLKKEPYIGVSPMNHADEISNNGSWRFTNVVDSWSWDGYENKKTTVEVYADARYIRLELNGKKIGVKKLKDYKAKFKCIYKAGELVAIGLDANKKEISRSSLSSAKKETILSVLPETTSIKADGMSLCFIPIEFTDSDGILKPYIEEPVTVEVEGPAVLAGLGSALAKTDESYTNNQFNSYRGRVLAIIRSTNQVGEVRVRVKAESGLEKSVTIISKENNEDNR